MKKLIQDDKKIDKNPRQRNPLIRNPLGERSSRLRCYIQNQKDLGSNPTRSSVKLREPTFGSNKFQNAVNKITLKRLSIQ